MNPIDQSITESNVIKALEKNGRVGHSNKPVLTFDGNIAGKTVHDDYVRVSSAVMDLTKAQKVTLLVGNGEETVEISEGLTIAKPTDGVTYLTDGEVNFAMTVENGGEADGTYVWYIGDEVGYEAMVSKVEFAETIQPIDPKFLPGVCLPVVELETVLTADAVLLTAKEEKQLAIASANSKYTLVALVPLMAISPILCTWFEEDGDAMLIGHFYDVIAKGMKQLCLFYAEGNCVGQVTDINV